MRRSDKGADHATDDNSIDNTMSSGGSGGILQVRFFKPGLQTLMVKLGGELVTGGAIQVLVLSKAGADEVQSKSQSEAPMYFEAVVLAQPETPLAEEFETRLLVDDAGNASSAAGDDRSSGSSRGNGGRGGRTEDAAASAASTAWRELVNAAEQEPTFSAKRIVHVKLTQQRVAVREYRKVPLIGTFTNFVRQKIFSAPLRSSVSFSLSSSSALPHPTCCISDGAGGVVVLRCKERDIMYATFRQLLQTKMGGRSATAGGGGGPLCKGSGFLQKTSIFFQKLKDAVPRAGAMDRALTLTVPREDVLAPLRALSDTQWKMRWQTSFSRGGRKEEAIDCNGVTKELFSIVSETLFAPAKAEGGDDGRQGDHHRSGGSKRKLFVSKGAGGLHPNFEAVSTSALKDFEPVHSL